MSFSGQSQLISQDDFAQQQRPKPQNADENGDGAGVGVQESSQYGNAMNAASSQLVNMLQLASGLTNMPAYNKHEADGRTGLVDPVSVNQGTVLPQLRRLDMQQNAVAIARSLPPQLQQQNEYISKMVATTVPQMQKQLKQTQSLYAQAVGTGGFVANKINNDLQKKRLTSIYAVV